MAILREGVKFKTVLRSTHIVVHVVGLQQCSLSIFAAYHLRNLLKIMKFYFYFCSKTHCLPFYEKCLNRIRTPKIAQQDPNRDQKARNGAELETKTYGYTSKTKVYVSRF